MDIGEALAAILPGISSTEFNAEMTQQ